MYKAIEKKECKQCELNIDKFCTWGTSKKKKKIVKTKSKKGKRNCRLIVK